MLLSPQREASLQDAIFLRDNFVDRPGWVQQRSIVRLAPGEKSSNSSEKVGQGTGWLPGVWKLKWDRIRTPSRNAARCECGLRLRGVDNH